MLWVNWAIISLVRYKRSKLAGIQKKSGWIFFFFGNVRII